MACKTNTTATSEFSLAEYFELFRGEGIHTETVLVTPEFARDALVRNVINRPISEKHVEELVWDIKADRWALTHQGLAFNVPEELIDGQHRATAVVRSGIAVPMRVTFNLEVGFDAPIDTGLRVRQPRDVLHLSSRVQAVCNALILLERASHRRSSTSQVGDAYALHRAGVDWATHAFPYQRGVTAPIMAAHAFAYPVAPRLVPKFVERFIAHTAVSTHDPAAALRRFLERSSRVAPDGRPLMLAVLRCLEAHCKGEPLPRLSVTDSGLTYFAEKRLSKGV